MAVDSTSVYFTAEGSINGGNGAVVKAPLDGGAPITLASGQDLPFGVAVDALNVYWTDEDDGTVRMLPLDGGPAATLASGQPLPTHIAVSAAGAYWVDYGACGPIDDAGDIGCSGSVMTAPLGGGAPTTLASELTYPDRIAVDSANAYFTTGPSGSVMKAPLDGGALIMIAGGLGDTEGIALDSTSVYFTEFGGSVVKLTPK